MVATLSWSSWSDGRARRRSRRLSAGRSEAERLVLELKDKVVPSGADAVVRAISSDDPRVVAREGLIGLGYSLTEAEEMLAGLDEGLAPAELISGALRRVA